MRSKGELHRRQLDLDARPRRIEVLRPVPRAARAVPVDDLPVVLEQPALLDPGDPAALEQVRKALVVAAGVAMLARREVEDRAAAEPLRQRSRRARGEELDQRGLAPM